MVILSTISYHLLIRSIVGNHESPVTILLLVYITALIISFILFLYTGKLNLHSLFSIKHIWKYLLIGLSVIGIELGYILAYRSGWNINSTALFSNTAVGVLIIPLGYVFFQEGLSINKTIGIVLCIAGLILINK